MKICYLWNLVFDKDLTTPSICGDWFGPYYNRATNIIINLYFDFLAAVLID